jgi:predicted nucleic acid-binding protein
LIHYFDTSALVQRYMEEAGSCTVRSVLRRGYAAVARITYAELLATVARLRQKQSGREVVDLPPRPAQTLQKAS